uniref:Uncharacterized protein n=1 Tax=Arundo donax TaxID=35708 RepID=A0A0A9FEP5_ARUDO
MIVDNSPQVRNIISSFPFTENFSPFNLLFFKHLCFDQTSGGNLFSPLTCRVHNTAKPLIFKTEETALLNRENRAVFDKTAKLLQC